MSEELDLSGLKVGDRVRYRNGTEGVVKENDGSEMPILVQDANDDVSWHSKTGAFIIGIKSMLDIVDVLSSVTATPVSAPPDPTPAEDGGHVFPCTVSPDCHTHGLTFWDAAFLAAISGGASSSMRPQAIVHAAKEIADAAVAVRHRKAT